ncbi:hypothetical protein BN1356_00716 [Streptococcus varani]|uniref:Uncharacterized protein n=1 Tax=Streptococcus varani TaxID=1608583 RepID=A0A0E4CS87_9STRE|nr:hypothetical protein [Streptococcus varani]CQR24367.1 hypothetical protein BN1356_00716 [Streptococcus varani]
MKIQLINFTGSNKKGYKISECNSFGNAKSLDMFDINIIDLSDEDIWKNYSYSKSFSELAIDNDFLTLMDSIYNSNKSKIIYVLPVNYHFKTEYQTDTYNGKKYHNVRVLLKDLGDRFSYNLKKIIYPSNFNISYERTDTTIGEQNVSADFYFSKYYSDEIENPIYSNISNKLVSFSQDRFTFSCLQLTNNDEFQAFLSSIYPEDNSEQNVPEWFLSVNLFDDGVQKTIVSNEKDIIIEAKRKIDDAERILKKNNYYKSILYKTGQELEDILVEMLSEMFEVREEFADNKDEDFSFNKDNKHYVFEFKGVTKDIKKTNIPQLITHVYKYAETNSIDENNIRRIIIANRFKDENVEDRLPVNKNIIDLAKNPFNSVLIIDSLQFLKMFEKYKNGYWDSKACLALLDQVGLLEIGE